MEVHVIEPQLSESVFGVKLRPHLLQQAVVMQLANRRAGTAATKSKGWVRGGGKKPWRQKGTGRARAGSIRSPIWVGGGTTFGPQPRDYSYRLPRTARRAALLSALSLKRRDGKIIVVDKFDIEQAKTRLMANALAQLNVESAVFLIAEPDLKIERSARNLPQIKVLRVDGLNVYDLLRYEHLIMTQTALQRLEERLTA
jgi:large subunit ribosomal protein L4